MNLKPTIGDAISSLCPKTNYSINDNKIVAWDICEKKSGETQPTDAEIDAELIRLQAEWTANQYQRDRQYPELGEQLDMLFHDMTAGKGSKTGEWYKAIAKVKTDNPKG